MKKYNIIYRKNNIVRFRASDKLAEDLKNESERTGMSVSKIVRLAINYYFCNH